MMNAGKPPMDLKVWTGSTAEAPASVPDLQPIWALVNETASDFPSNPLSPGVPGGCLIDNSTDKSIYAKTMDQYIPSDLQT